MAKRPNNEKFSVKCNVAPSHKGKGGTAQEFLSRIFIKMGSVGTFQTQMQNSETHGVALTT